MNLDVLYPDLIEIRLMLEPEIFVLAAHRGKKRDFNKAADILKDIQKMNLQMAQSNSTNVSYSFGSVVFSILNSPVEKSLCNHFCS